MPKNRRKHIIDTVSDLIGNFLYYGRKEDDELPVGAIEAAVAAGEITADEIIDEFANGLRRSCKIPEVSSRVITCVYCGHAYKPGVPTHGHEALTEHIKICPKHPMRDAEKKITELRQLLREVYHHPANVTGERFSEHLMDANLELAKKVAIEIGDIKA